MPELTDTLKKIRLLETIDFLCKFSSSDLEELAANFEWREFAEGAEIVCQGEEKAGFYIIESGKAEAVIERESNQPLIKKILGNGDSFGEDDLFVGKPSSVTVRCLSYCKVLTLDPVHFAYMLVRWPEIYGVFTSKLYDQLNQVNLDLLKARYREFVRTGLKVNQLKYEFYGIWGDPATTIEIEKLIEDLTLNRKHTLLFGEKGTGQQMMAWFVHRKRFGEAAPFIFLEGERLDQQKVNPFYEIMDFPGRFASVEYFLEVSEGGTLFIRDIDKMSPRMQDTLAKALEAKGSSLWVVGTLLSEALTDRIIPRLRKQLAFKYFLTPLRHRKKDIMYIAEGVLEKIALRNTRKTPLIDKQAREVLAAYTYREGNIKELIQIIERAFFLSDGETIGLEHLFLGRKGQSIGRSINLLSFDWAKKIIMSGIFPGWFEKLFLFVFWAILAVLLFAPVEVGNYSLMLIWGLWWPLTAMLAFWVGRIWCSVCPFSATMEIIQKFLHWNRPVPPLLKKYDYIFVTFLFLLFPWLEEILGMRGSRVSTALWLLGVTTAVTLTGIVFTRHTWCRHLCPLGGYIGMASLNGMVEVRADLKTCVNKCTTHDCYKGSSQVSGCPMSQHTAFLDTNNPCKLCLRCVRTCRREAVQVNLRVPAREVWHLVRVNQGFTIFIGTGLAVLLPLFYFHSYYNVWPLEKWQLWFSIGYWGAALLGAVLTWLLVRPFKTPFASKRVRLAFSFVPLVITGNVIYQIKFIPGATTLMIGLAKQVSSGVMGPTLTAVPIYQIGQVLVGVSGVTLTLLSIGMVLFRSRKNRNHQHSGNLSKQ